MCVCAVERHYFGKSFSFSILVAIRYRFFLFRFLAVLISTSSTSHPRKVEGVDREEGLELGCQHVRLDRNSVELSVIRRLLLSLLALVQKSEICNIAIKHLWFKELPVRTL
ncbi:unnamed protein product [Calypogeia fissa]